MLSSWFPLSTGVYLRGVYLIVRYNIVMVLSIDLVSGVSSAITVYIYCVLVSYIFSTG